jgi:hypothetical protein
VAEIAGKVIPYTRHLRVYEKLFSKLLQRQIVISKMPGRCREDAGKLSWRAVASDPIIRGHEPDNENQGTTTRFRPLPGIFFAFSTAFFLLTPITLSSSLGF